MFRGDVTNNTGQPPPEGSLITDGRGRMHLHLVPSDSQEPYFGIDPLIETIRPDVSEQENENLPEKPSDWTTRTRTIRRRIGFVATVAATAALLAMCGDTSGAASELDTVEQNLTLCDGSPDPDCEINVVREGVPSATATDTEFPR